MSEEHKLKGMKDEFVGKIKEETGKILNKPDLELKGKIQKNVGKGEQMADDALDNIQESYEDLKDDAKEKVNDFVDKMTDKK